MTQDDKNLTDRRFYKAEQEASFAEARPHETPQTRHPAYRLAFRDTDFLLREELRPVRFQLELLKPAARSKGRFRLYGPEALLRVRWIGKLQDMGLSLTDIKSIVRDWEDVGTAPAAMTKMREVYKAKLAETQKQIEHLRNLQREILASLTYLDTCDVCDPSRLLGACSCCDHHPEDQEVPDLVAGFRA